MILWSVKVSSVTASVLLVRCTDLFLLMPKILTPSTILGDVDALCWNGGNYWTFCSMNFLAFLVAELVCLVLAIRYDFL